MHPRDQLAANPDRPALIMAGSGEVITFAELDRRANRCAQLFRKLGLKPGDRVAFWLENNARFFEICWGAHNAGLLYVPILSLIHISRLMA